MDITRLKILHAACVKAAVLLDRREVPEWRFDGKEIRTAKEVAAAMNIPLVEAKERLRNTIPGWEGSVGPFPSQYGQQHVYARDVHSGAGNCVCGRAPQSSIHAIARKDVYAASGEGVTMVGVGTRTRREAIYRRANALAYGHRRRRRHKRRSER
jgi:hypothetical protein